MRRTNEGAAVFRLKLMMLGAVLFSALGQTVQAQQRPLPLDEQNAVNRAIERGVHYLKKTQLGTGTWPQLKGKHAVGYAALGGLTLLECGVSPKDPAIRRTAFFLRTYAAKTKIDATYELALAILFLDRLGDPKDEKIIRTFALRLIAGQSATGGWGYKCPMLTAGDQSNLLTFLRRHDDPVPGGMPFLAGGPPAPGRMPFPAGDAPDMPGIAEQPGKKPNKLALMAQLPGGPSLEGTTAKRGNPPLPDTTSSLGDDKSHYLQAPTSDEPSLWREWMGFSQTGYSLDLPEPATPDEKKLKDKEPPKEKTDKAKDAAHDDGKAADAKTPNKKAVPQHHNPYVIPPRLHALTVVQDPARHILLDPAKKASSLIITTTDNSNTQFAILALWTAQRHGVPMMRTLNLIVRRYATSQSADGSWSYHYLFGGGLPASAPMTCVGLIGLAVGHGLANPQNGQPVRDPRILNGFAALSKYIGKPADRLFNLPMQNLYFLWSVERVAVLYGLPMIGDKDWYRWGAQTLVANQAIDGCWIGGKYPGSCPPLDTCLALLFLERANLVKDLTSRLPFNPAELNNGVLEKLAPPPSKKLPEPIEKPTTTPSEPSKPSQPSESDNLISKPIGQISGTTAMPAKDASENSSGSNKKWIVLALLLFVLLTGAGLFFFLVVADRKKKAEDEDEERRPHDKRKGTKKKRKLKSMASGRDS